MGFGQGGAEEDAEPEQASDEPPGGGGGGGGAGARPIAMIEVTADETIIHPIVDETKVALAGIALGAWIIFLLLVTIRRVFAEGNDDTMNVKLAYGRNGLTVALPENAADHPPQPALCARPGGRNRRHAGRPAQPDREPAPARVGLPGRHSRRSSFPTSPAPSRASACCPSCWTNCRARVPDEQILLINGVGTHRANTDAELRAMLGDAIVDRYTIHQHDSRDESQMVYLGQSSYDHAIWISRAYMEADVKLLTGFIEPHIFAGYSGGPKAVLPAVAGAEIILDNHSGRMLSDPKATWGVTRGNAVWEEMLEVALLTEPDFLFNVSLNRDKGITGVFCGSLEAAHAAGVEHVRSTAMVGVDEPFDVALTNNSGYPLDLNLYQTDKGISAAAQVVRQGGAILTASECWDGIPEHGNYKALLAGADSPQAAAGPGALARLSRDGPVAGLLARPPLPPGRHPHLCRGLDRRADPPGHAHPQPRHRGHPERR